MFCPECNLEYREGHERCADCNVPLVDSLPADEEGDPAPLDLVTVFEAGDPGVLAMAHSMLDEQQIPYLTLGEGVQDLFGIGRIGTGYNILTGPARIQVTPDREAEVRELLAQLEVPPEPLPEEEPG